jgi:steroid delta-isomerase-like uncharacterized protein
MKHLIIFLSGTVLCILIGCQPQKSANEMMAEKNKQLMSQLYDAYNAKDWDKISTFIAADYVEHNPMPNQKPGLEGMKETFTMMTSAFPDFKVTANKIIAEGDHVCNYYTVTATHQGDWMGMPATGKSMNVEGIEIVRIANGKVVEHWEVFDAMKMMTQLGMMPAPGAKPEEAKKDMMKK